MHTRVRPNFFAARTWESVSKSAEFVTSPGQCANAMRRAFHALRNGRPGPVIVEMPDDVCHQPVSEDAMTYSSPRLTFHPAGFTHGPHPNALRASLESPATETDEVSVMIDTRDALDVGPAAEAVEWSGYVDSWREGASPS